MEFQLRRSCILKPQHEPKIDQEIDMKPPSTSDFRLKPLAPKRKGRNLADPPFRYSLKKQRYSSLPDLLSWCVARSRSRSCRFGRGQIASHLVFAHVEHNQFVRRVPCCALHVELYGFTRGLVLLLDRLIVCEHRHSVLGLFLIGFAQRDLHRSDALGSLGFL